MSGKPKRDALSQGARRRARSCAARRSTSASGRSKTAQWAGAIDNVGGEMLDLAHAHRGHLGQHRQHRPGREPQARDDGDAVHPARREPARRQLRRAMPRDVRLAIWKRLATRPASRGTSTSSSRARSASTSCRRRSSGYVKSADPGPHGRQDRLTWTRRSTARLSAALAQLGLALEPAQVDALLTLARRAGGLESRA